MPKTAFKNQEAACCTASHSIIRPLPPCAEEQLSQSSTCEGLTGGRERLEEPHLREVNSTCPHMLTETGRKEREREGSQSCLTLLELFKLWSSSYFYCLALFHSVFLSSSPSTFSVGSTLQYKRLQVTVVVNDTKLNSHPTEREDVKPT